MTEYEQLMQRLQAGEALTGNDAVRFQELHDAVVGEQRAKTLLECRGRGDWEGYLLAFGGSHERLTGLLEIAKEIDDAGQFWRCVLDTWAGDDAPGLSEDEWRYLLTDV
jgi:hypothetical protein